MKIPGRGAPMLLSQDRTANPVESKGSNPYERAMDLRKSLGLSLGGYSPVFDIVLTTVPVSISSEKQ